MSDGTVTPNKLRPMPKPKPKPVLADGRGLKYSEVRALLAEKHDSGISLDDPILMLVTILNVYLGELETATRLITRRWAIFWPPKPVNILSKLRKPLIFWKRRFLNLR